MHDPLDLIIGYINDDLTAEQFEELQQLLNSSAEARQLYRDTIDQGVSLRSILISAESMPIHVQTSAPASRSVSKRFVWYTAAAMAAAIALALTAWFVFTPAQNTSTPVSPVKPAVAMLTDVSTDAVFADSMSQMNPGAELSAGPIRLISGKAQLMFNSTAVVDLSGPCTLTMTGSNSASLMTGALTAYVPDHAHGFSIDLPGGARVVDLGTRFGITIDDKHISWINVADGRVRIEPAVGAVRHAVAGDRVMIVDGKCIDVKLTDLPLVNADFEDIQLEDGEIRPKLKFPGWSQTGEAQAGVFNPGSRQYGDGKPTSEQPIDPVGLSGANAAFFFAAGGSSIKQKTPYLAEPGSRYELRVAVGHRSQHVNAVGYRIELLAGDNVIGFIESDKPTGPSGQFTDVIVVVDPLSSNDPRIGQPLTVRLIKHEPFGYFDFDNIRLQALTPWVDGRTEDVTSRPKTLTPKGE